MPQRIKQLLLGFALVSALALVGCEQRPADADPPPSTPDQRDPDTPPLRQPLGGDR